MAAQMKGSFCRLIAGNGSLIRSDTKPYHALSMSS